MTIATNEAFVRFGENEQRVNKFVNENGTYQTNESAPRQVETLPSLMTRLKDRYLNAIYRGNWNSATAYDINDGVVKDGVVYLCAQAHVSSVFVNDLNSGKWGVAQSNANLITFSHELNYAIGSIGKKLKGIISADDAPFNCSFDGITDDSDGLQQFFDYVTSNGYHGILPNGTPLLKSPVVITVGNIGFKITGVSSSATVILVDSSFSGSDSAIWLKGSGQPVSFEISGFSVKPKTTTTGSATTGFKIGDSSIAQIGIYGFQFSKITDIQVSNFAELWNICHARMIYFERCGGWNNSFSLPNACLTIRQNGAFTGDFVFNKCQFVNSKTTGNRNLRIYSPVGPYNNANGNNSIAGIKFTACDFYAGYNSIEFYASSGSYIGDIWFTEGCQHDQEAFYSVYVESNNSSTLIEDLHFEGMYIAKGSQANMSFTSTGTGGLIKSVWVESCNIMDAPNRAINFFGGGCQDVHVNHNVIRDSSANGPAIEFNGTTGVECNFNKARSGILNQHPYYLIGFDAGTTDIVAIGNNGFHETDINTILDNSGNTQKIIQGNLGYNPIPPRNVAMTSSPHTYTNLTGEAVMATLSGGTVSNITLDGWEITPSSSMTILIPPNKSLIVTYSGSTTLNVFGL